MDRVAQFLCRTETRKLPLIMAIAAAFVLGLQYFELPYGNVLLSSHLPSRNSTISSVKESSSSSVESETLNNATTSEISNSTLAVYGRESGIEEPLLGSKQPNSTTVSRSLNFTYPLNVTAQRNETEENGRGMVKHHVSEIKRDLNKSSSLVSNDIVKKDNSSVVKKESGQVDGNLVSEIAVTSKQNSSSKDVNETAETVPLSNNRASGSIRSYYSDVPKNSSKTNASKVEGNKKKEKNSKKPPSVVIPLTEMKTLLMKSHNSPHSLAPRWASKVDEELLFAKSQIREAQLIKNDKLLYPPLYHNLSMFKRSYELMEKILKVYIYSEGDRPIFHQPEAMMDGIYASEGWFMKLMETSKRFVTKDPEKAHLFYLAFSSRVLQLKLYVRDSHKRTNLVQYLRGYVDMIMFKYPFWNRTGGSDHFFAACHDWAPAETRGPLLNCIRALCNADAGLDFVIGKDVSLPETKVSSAQNPYKNQGGNRPSKRPILVFFAGNMHGYVRPILLNYWLDKNPEMKILGRIDRKTYTQYMKSSNFCICAKGYEVNSPRIVEAIMLGCVPVIISDNYVPPFLEVLNWESFAVFVLEKDIPNLKKILLSIPKERYVEMQKRVVKVQHHFLWHDDEPVKYDLFHMILHSIWYNRVFQMGTS